MGHSTPPAVVPIARTSSAVALASALDFQSAIERRGAACDASGRLADELRALALEISGYHDDMPAADRAWLREAVQRPVADAVAAALETLNRELAGSLYGAPAVLRPQMVVAGHVTRIDFE